MVMLHVQGLGGFPTVHPVAPGARCGKLGRRGGHSGELPLPLLWGDPVAPVWAPAGGIGEEKKNRAGPGAVWRGRVSKTVFCGTALSDDECSSAGITQVRF
ncbi:hypothetical protein [Kyrpidia tusciae]